MRVRHVLSAAGCQLLLAACGTTTVITPTAPAPAPAAAPPPPAAASRDSVVPPRQRVAPPRVAAQLGLMPVASTGVTEFRVLHPNYDGRGVLIAILDSGVDPGIEGLRSTSTGAPKILDVRDFSGEGDVPLRPAGAGRWTGTLHELTFGGMPQADFNGDGSNRTSYAVEVARDSAGWMARVDTDADGSLDDEVWLRDFLVRRETFSFSSPRLKGARGPITAALNFSEENGQPRVAIHLDTSGHGSHVAGIAAGYNIYGVPGFHGVAPGAQLIGLRIANNARGSVSVTGSMVRAMEYAARVAAERRLPLVMNLSFGVGNAEPGRAVMDSIVNAFLIEHPDIVFAIAAGNDGPGTSTLGQPGSAELAAGVGASYPGGFAQLQFNNGAEVMGWWSSRGGELAKPDIVAPGLAYSTVPGWNIGEEIKGGTSMATPHVAGLAALLVSAMVQEGRPYSAGAILQALRATAQPFAGLPWIDQGPGLARITAAYEWLRAGHEAPRYSVAALQPAAARTVVAPASRTPTTSAAYRRGGLTSPADTIQRFRVSLVPERGIARRARIYRLVSDAPWLRAAQPTVTIDSATGSAVVEVRYAAAALGRPGRYAGTITGVAAADSSAGPAFALVNTVIVPADAIHRVRAVTPMGTADHLFVTVPPGAAGLTVSLTAADSTRQGSVSLFEPSGRPARGAKAEDVGGESGATRVRAAVSANDIVPGVWEVVIQAMPGKDLVHDLEVRVPPVRLTRVDSSAATAGVRFEARGDTALVTAVQEVGADTSWTETVVNALAVRTFAVPPWASRMVAEVEVSPATWDQLTDLAITMFDAEGAQLGNGAMNYPFHRVVAELPAARPAGFAATLELFPGFARPQASTFEARVRVRFEADSQALAAAGAEAFRQRDVAATPGGTLELPSGWRRVMRVTAGASADDPLATSVLVPVGRP